jgi:hypothetical protein
MLHVQMLAAQLALAIALVSVGVHAFLPCTSTMCLNMMSAKAVPRRQVLQHWGSGLAAAGTLCFANFIIFGLHGLNFVCSLITELVNSAC